jgi:hypothetical protein
MKNQLLSKKQEKAREKARKCPVLLRKATFGPGIG